MYSGFGWSSGERVTLDPSSYLLHIRAEALHPRCAAPALGGSGPPPCVGEHCVLVYPRTTRYSWGSKTVLTVPATVHGFV